MTNDRFNEIVKFYIDFVAKMEATKGKEYANGEDRLGNFKRAAAKLGVAPEVICHVYLSKHLDSIDNFVKTVQATGKIPDTSEPISGRIGDAIVYLLLLAGLITERADNENPL